MAPKTQIFAVFWYSVFGQVDRIFGRTFSAETGRIFGIRSYTKIHVCFQNVFKKLPYFNKAMQISWQHWCQQSHFPRNMWRVEPFRKMCNRLNLIRYYYSILPVKNDFNVQTVFQLKNRLKWCVGRCLIIKLHKSFVKLHLVVKRSFAVSECSLHIYRF